MDLALVSKRMADGCPDMVAGWLADNGIFRAQK
jgi:hypothetical protein